MKMITASELYQHLYEYLVQAQEDEIIVTLDNGALVRLSAIEEENLIDDALESDPRFTQLIDERREHYQRLVAYLLMLFERRLLMSLYMIWKMRIHTFDSRQHSIQLNWVSMGFALLLTTTSKYNTPHASLRP